MNNNIGARLKKFSTSWEMVLLAILLLEFTVFSLASSKFTIARMLLSINDIISICVISLFVTFVMITGGIDIQAGSIVGLTSIVIGVTWQDMGLNIWGAVALSIIVAAVCGAISGFFVAYCKVQPMVVTLGGSFLYTGVALLISNLSSTASYKGISGFPEQFTRMAKYKAFGIIPFQLILFIILIILCYILLHKSKYGRKIFLVGVNPQAAEASGINSRLVIMSTYVLSGIGASIAGIVLTAYLGTAKSDIGVSFTLPIITAVVLGGTLNTGGKGSIIGTALAAVVIGVLKFGLPLCFKVSTQYLDIPVGMLLLAVVIGRAVAQNGNMMSKLKKLLGVAKQKA